MRRFICLPACLAFGLLGCATTTSGSGDVPVRLSEAIKTLHSRARILQPEEMDLSSCGQLDHHPGLVKADFNGDGAEDYAVLLVVGNVKEKKEWEGRTWEVVDMRFTVFTSREGKLVANVLNRFETLLPSGTGLDLYVSKTIKERESDKVIELQTPAIEHYFCEKSSSVFYWGKKGLEEVVIAD